MKKLVIIIATVFTLGACEEGAIRTNDFTWSNPLPMDTCGYWFGQNNSPFNPCNW